jgi:hypothetical protein
LSLADKGTQWVLADLVTENNIRFEIKLVQRVCVVKEYIPYDRDGLRFRHFKTVNGLRQNLDQREEVQRKKQVQSSPHSHRIALPWLARSPDSTFQATNVRRLRNDKGIVGEE